MTWTIGLLDDDRGHRSHQELNALVPQLAEKYGKEGTVTPVAGSRFGSSCAREKMWAMGFHRSDVRALTES